jgi:uncharacterized protein (DUF486 family)
MEHGGPFSLVELKVIQEVITRIVFLLFALVFFKNANIQMESPVGIYVSHACCIFDFQKIDWLTSDYLE